MKFKVGDKVKRVRAFDVGNAVPQRCCFVGVVVKVIGEHCLYFEGHASSYEASYYELVTPVAPVYDNYTVYSGGIYVAQYRTFEGADTRARGLAEGGKIATVKGEIGPVLIATYQRPTTPVEVTFANQT